MRHFLHRHEPPVPAGSVQVGGRIEKGKKGEQKKKQREKELSVKAHRDIGERTLSAAGAGQRASQLTCLRARPRPALPGWLLCVQVVAATPDIVAVNKPAGMPVHVSGQYRKNTVLGVLQAERPDLGELLPVGGSRRGAGQRAAQLCRRGALGQAPGMRGAGQGRGRAGPRRAGRCGCWACRPPALHLSCGGAGACE